MRRPPGPESHNSSRSNNSQSRYALHSLRNIVSAGYDQARREPWHGELSREPSSLSPQEVGRRWPNRNVQGSRPVPLFRYLAGAYPFGNRHVYASLMTRPFHASASSWTDGSRQKDPPASCRGQGRALVSAGLFKNKGYPDHGPRRRLQSTALRFGC
jgi:hypothetical protein